jgi:hypothetical protein
VLGAPIIKAVLEKDSKPLLAKRRKAEREVYKRQMLDDEKRVSKDQLKRITRYVGDLS